MKNTIPINEMIKPAMANPFGVLKIPMNERINPKTQTNHPRNGIQPTKIAITDMTNPAIPMPLDGVASC
ncbi:hypothetical protein [Chryseobacterium taiwanense]|uniref:hypothetical protein n=1 Tax=Chryseobacterium taiwanense TaxID=363331 RepID=UPI000AA30CB0|nr:hypothetical protein [Chryseobacterium taiwanense]